MIAGDRIFLTAAEESKLIVLCLERRSGRMLWRREVERLHTTPVFHKANDSASPSPATDGKNVYAFFGDLGLISFSAEGAERWRVPLGPFNTFYGMGASPVLAEGMVLMLCDARSKPFLIAVDAATGRVRWRVERKYARMEGHSTPVIYRPDGGPAQVVVLGAQRVDAYSLATGEPLWWSAGLGAFPVASPVIAGNVVIVSTYGSDTPEGPTFDEYLKSDKNQDGLLSKEELASFEEFGQVDANNDGFMERSEWDMIRNSGAGRYGLVGIRLEGRGELSPSNVAWHNKKNYPMMPTPVIYRGVLYTVKSGGIVASMDPASGEAFKVDRVKDAIEEYYASLVAADGKLFLLSENCKLVVLKADRQWDVLSVSQLGEQCFATPAIAGGAFYVRTRSHLYAFGTRGKTPR